jgi:hypothetical protein
LECLFNDRLWHVGCVHLDHVTRSICVELFSSRGAFSLAALDILGGRV